MIGEVPPPNPADATPAGTVYRFITIGRDLLRGTMQPWRPQEGRMTQQIFGSVINAANNARPPSTPPINPNAPPTSSSSSTAPFIVGSLYWGAKGPKRRYTKLKRRKRTDPPVDKYGGWPGGPLCGTDTQCDEWARDHGVPWQSRGPFPMPDTMPPPVPVKLPTGAIGRVIGAAARVLNPLIWVLWPSSTADDDTIPFPKAEPKIPAKGPPRRGRVRIRTPGPPGHPFDFPFDPIEVLRPYAIPTPKPSVPGTGPSSRTNPRQVVRPAPGAEPKPKPLPRTVPTPAPKPLPLPTKKPVIPPWLEPYLPLLTQPVSRPSSRPVQGLRPRPLTPPLQEPLEYRQPTPGRADRCQCTQTQERKRRRKQCSNPIVSKRTRTKDGRLLRTITREIKCQA